MVHYKCSIGTSGSLEEKIVRRMLYEVLYEARVSNGLALRDSSAQTVDTVQQGIHDCHLVFGKGDERLVMVNLRLQLLRVVSCQLVVQIIDVYQGNWGI